MITKTRFLFLLSVLFFLFSCEKFQKDPEVDFMSTNMSTEGVYLKAIVKEGKKNVTEVGFCYGKTSKPEADLNSSMHLNTITLSMNENGAFSTTIPDWYFESYTGYYFRPFAKKGGKVVYGSEVYFEAVQQPLTTPACTPADNFFNPGNSVIPGAQNFFNVNTSTSFDSYNISAYTNNHNVKLEFERKPKTGIYYTSPYAKASENYVYVILNVGSLSKLPENGHPVYVNEVEKDKYEITFCEMPWKFNSSNTVYATSKIIVD